MSRGNPVNAGRRDTGNRVLGQYIAAKRQAAGLSYREFGERIGKAPSTVQAWEQGKRMPGLDDLFALAHVLGADLGDLVNMAMPPVKELERRLSGAKGRYKRLLREAPGTEAVVQARREVAFLRSLLAGRREQEGRLRLPPRAVPLYDLKMVPLVGGVRAGRPRLAVEEALGYTGIPHDVDVDYALTVEDGSMVGAGISPGDVVWVKRADAAVPGDTVVALLGGEEVTVKHLVKEGGRYLLRANNPERDYPDVVLGPEDRIIGVVRRVVKRPGPPPERQKGTGPAREPAPGQRFGERG